MFAEPSILETIASVSKALHEYERAGGFAPMPRRGRRKRSPRCPRRHGACYRCVRVAANQ
jgi:hypothetical protein